MKKLLLFALLVLAPLAFAIEIEVGMPEAKLIELKGAPLTKATLGKKAIYRWPDMEVTLVDGKVDQVRLRDRVAEKQNAATQDSAGAKGKNSAAKGTMNRVAPIVNPPAGGIGRPGVHTLRVVGRISQVLPVGIILDSWESWTVEPYGSHNGSNRMQQTLLIVGAPANLLDGDRFSGVVYLAGRFSYAGTIVHRYATSPGLAKAVQTRE